MKHLKLFENFNKSNIDLSIELENKLRELSDDSELTIDDFLDEFGIKDSMTGFAWASILNGKQKYENISDDEFRKIYNEYKSNLSLVDESLDSKPSISFEDAKSWIKENYSEDKVIELFDDEVSGGDWIDREQMEEEGFESEHDYYTDYGNGEVESVVIDVIFSDLKSKFTLDFDMYSDDTDLHDFMKEEYMCLWKA